MGGIYGIRYMPGNKIIYVGKTVDFDRRKKEHFKFAEKGIGGCRKLIAKMRAYGIEKYEFVVLQDGITDRVHMLLSEGQWARDLKTLHSMGFGGANIIDPWSEKNANSPEWRRRLTITWRRKAKDPAWLKKVTEINREIARRPGHREKMVSAARRKWSKPSYREKHREALMRAIHSEEHKKRMNNIYTSHEWKLNQKSGSERRSQSESWIKNLRDGVYRRTMNETWRKNVSSAARVRAQDPGWKMSHDIAMKKMAKPVVCIETGAVYQGVNEVERVLGICAGNITVVCKGGRLKTAGGYHWRYATEEEKNLIISA